MLSHIFVLLVVSYVVFVFISDLLNPFAQTKALRRRRKSRLGRAAAISSLAAGSVALYLFAIDTLDGRAAVGFYIMLTAVVMILPIIKYIKSAIWQ